MLSCGRAEVYATLHIPERILSAEKYFKEKAEVRTDGEHFNVNLHYAQ